MFDAISLCSLSTTLELTKKNTDESHSSSNLDSSVTFVHAIVALLCSHWAESTLDMSRLFIGEHVCWWTGRLAHWSSSNHFSCCLSLLLSYRICCGHSKDLFLYPQDRLKRTGHDCSRRKSDRRDCVNRHLASPSVSINGTIIRFDLRVCSDSTSNMKSSVDDWLDFAIEQTRAEDVDDDELERQFNFGVHEKKKEKTCRKEQER